MTDMKKKIFLTFDMDWATDGVLKNFYKVMCENNLTGTLNVTHKTEMLEVFRTNENIELGIHLNYNQLLSGHTLEGTEGTYIQDLSELKTLVPEAVSIRSHALTTSTMITSHYDVYGIKYDLNTWVEPMKGMSLKS